jgi:hypothetical protein
MSRKPLASSAAALSSRESPECSPSVIALRDIATAAFGGAPSICPTEVQIAFAESDGAVEQLATATSKAIALRSASPRRTMLIEMVIPMTIRVLRGVRNRDRPSTRAPVRSLLTPSPAIEVGS